MYESFPGRESVAMIDTFFNESSQIRKRAYTAAPTNLTEMMASVGRWFVILTAGAITAVVARACRGHAACVVGRPTRTRSR